MAAGLKATEAASRLDMSVQRVYQIQQSPLFQALVEHKRAAHSLAVRERVAEKLLGDGERNIDFLIGLRNGAADILADDTDKVRLRLDASKVLIDRQAPKRSEQTSESTFVLRVEAGERAALDAVAAEVLVDMDDVAAEPVQADPVPVPLYDDAVAEADARDLARALEREVGDTP